MTTKALAEPLGRGGASVATESPRSGPRLYLDTADWRLYGAGWTLEVDGGASLTLRDAQSDEPRFTVALPEGEPPTGSGDLPAGTVWDRLRPVIAERRLLVQLRAEVRTQRLAVLDGERKTTARLQLTRYSVCRRNLRFATVLPVRGYDRRAAQVEAAVGRLGVKPAEETLMVSLLAAAGRPEPGADRGPGVPLERDESAARATCAVLERLRGHVVANEEGVRHQLDIEFLHDYRVAIRRARSIVRQSEGVLPADEVTSLGAELKWLGGHTSLPRDLDVHLEEFEGRDEPELEPLRAYLTERREQAQEDLLSILDSDRYKSLLDRWESVAAGASGRSASGGSGPDASGDGGRPAGEVIDEHVARAFRRVLKRGRAIHADTPAEALHDLRKRAKELRYLLECFQTLYPEEERTPVVKELKLLQDNLGEFQDCQVQLEALHTMADDLVQRRAAPAATVMALGRLSEDLERRERRARDDFDSRFARFSSTENEKRYEALVHHAGKIA